MTAFSMLTLAGSVYLGPHYAVDGYASIAAVHVIWWLAGRRWRARRADVRIVQCLCHVCGYDRRGGAGFTCPECGTAT